MNKRPTTRELLLSAAKPSLAWLVAGQVGEKNKMSIEDPEQHWERVKEAEYFHMTREDLLFLVLCEEIQYPSGKPKFYRAATIAERIEKELCRQERCFIFR